MDSSRKPKQPENTELNVGNVHEEFVQKAQRAFELDLEAMFRALEEEVLKRVEGGVRRGATPTQIIRGLERFLGEE